MPVSDSTKDAIRARNALGVLIDNDGNLPRAQVWEEVTAITPLADDEQDRTDSGNLRHEVDWNFRTAEFVKADWLHKGGADGWTVTDLGRQAFTEMTNPTELVREARLLYSAWDQTRMKDRAVALASRIVPHDSAEEEVIRAAGVFVERALVAGESVFSPGRIVWTDAVVRELEGTTIGQASIPGLSFIEQLASQLDNLSDDAKLLMAELVMLQLLPASTNAIGALKKAERVESVLRSMEHPVQIPLEFTSAFSGGAFNPGTRMMNGLGAAMNILVNFAGAWIRAGSAQHEQLLDDPWAFRDFVREVAGERFPSQRWSLMFLVHPQTFVSIVSDQHKERIRNVFLGEVGETTGDLDRDLFAITIALQLKNRAPFDFYNSPFREKWDGGDPGRDENFDSDEGGADAGESGSGERTAFPAAGNALAAKTFVDESWLQEVLDLLERRNQIILYGPPGTGKTFLAKALAKHAAAGGSPTIVQFHPSYSYEDFVEGYRPEVEDGQLVYRLKPGPFLKIARDARNNPETNYVLVIDEINRGNIAKVFGELYFLLEYRDDDIVLLYGGERFQLPGNVFLIGTMNTTDRSIALLDAAMRRRFAFVELHPDKSPTSTVLERWLEANGLPREPDLLLTALNARIADPSSRIGPSYLMALDKDDDLDKRLAEIWRYELMPLLEEAYYGDGRDLPSTFGLEALRRSLGVTDLDE
jgi:5-methylcytosine-specific restriction protein B